MKLTRVVLLLIATAGILAPCANADGPSVKSLEDQIAKLVADTPPPASDDDMLKLNDLKVALMAAIDSSLTQLKVDKGKVSAESQDALQIVIAGRQSERKSLSLSLGKWNTGIAGGGGIPVAAVPVPAAGAAVPLGSCSLVADLPRTNADETIFKYSAKCVGGGSPTSIAMWPTLGKVNKTLVTPTSLVGLNSPQYGSKGAHSDGVVILSAIKGSGDWSFELHVPSAALRGGATPGTFYITSGTTDISTCVDATATVPGCFVGSISVPAIRGDGDLEVDQMFQALVGASVSGASGTDPRAAFLADGKFDLPLTHDRSKNIAAPWSVSAYTKIGTMQSPSSLASLVTATNPTDALSSVTSSSLEKIVQSFELGGAVSYRIAPIHNDVWRAGDNVFTLNLIGGGGMLTPLSPSQTNPPLFVATDDVRNYYTNLQPNNLNQVQPPPLNALFDTACNIDPKTGKPQQACYVAVYPADRATFFRYYGGGLRLKMYFKDTTAGHSEYRFPGNLDVTVGQNEYVTGGKLHGWVLHFGGTVPVPKVDYLYINTRLSGYKSNRLNWLA